MSLPMQVQRDVEELEAYEKMLAEHAAGEPTAPEATNPPEEPAAVPPAAVATVPTTVAESKVVELKVPEQSEETWQQKFRTLTGKYNAEVPVLHAQNKELNKTVQQLRAEMDALNTARQAEIAAKSTVPDEEVSAFYGPEEVAIQNKLTNKVVAPIQAQLEKLAKENEALRAQVEITESTVATSSFEQKLNSRVGDFEKLNSDPKWIEWLDGYDPMLRAPRRSAAQDAYARGDLEALVDYVSMFQKTVTPPAQDQREAELSSQVAPSRAATAPVTTAPISETRVYSAREAEALFDKVAKLNRAGNYSEASSLEAELTLAYNSGRVR